MVLSITQTFYPKTRAQWRAWLEKNHSTKSEIWLIYFKKETGKPTISYEDAIEEALCFGWVESRERSLDSEKYAQRFTPRRPKSHWSVSNIKRFKILVKEGLITEAGKKVFENSIIK